MVRRTDEYSTRKHEWYGNIALVMEYQLAKPFVLHRSVFNSGPGVGPAGISVKEKSGVSYYNSPLWPRENVLAL